MFFDILIVFLVIMSFVVYYTIKIKPKLDPLKKAQSLAKEKKFQDAVTEYKRVLYSNPEDTNIHYKIAELYLKINKVDEAIFHLNEIVRIDKYGQGLNELNVLKKLANAYLTVNNLPEAIKTYIEVLNIIPDDVEALYHVSFTLLGQEEFELAQKYFNKLVKLEDSFEIFFGMGICSYQNKNWTESVKYFKESLSIKPESEIALIAVSFALFYTKQYKEGITYIKRLIERTQNENVQFISMRLHAFLLILYDKINEAIEVFEDMLKFTKKRDNDEEIKLTLYDLGFALIMANKKNNSYNYWTELSQLDDEFQNIKELMELLHNEINQDEEDELDELVFTTADSIDNWLANAFSTDFLWQICGLKSSKKIDVKSMMTTRRVNISRNEPEIGREDSMTESAVYNKSGPVGDYGDRLSLFCNLETEKFRIISNRLVSKMGYKVDEILQTYRDADGVDFLAVDGTGNKVLVWIRRWQGTKVGEISLRNFAQAINDIRAPKGLFLTTAELTEPAQLSLNNLSKVNVIYPQEIAIHLKGLV